MKTQLTAELSAKSLKNAIKQLNEFKNGYEKGIDNAVLSATKMMYEKVKQYCYENGINEHTSNIKMEYDSKNKRGTVKTADIVIIMNEMGSGIVGSNNPHPSLKSPFKAWKYDVNQHGEKGWKYPKEDGSYGHTKGLPSRHMFYDAFNDIQKEIGNVVEIELRKTVGDFY